MILLNKSQGPTLKTLIGKTSIREMHTSKSCSEWNSFHALDQFMMQNGEKTRSRKIVQDVFLRLSVHHAQKTKVWLPGSFIFAQALENVKPAFEIRKQRKGGTTQQVPVPCPIHRQQSLALRWILEAAREKKKLEFSFTLAQVIYSSFCREGKVFQRRNECHKLAETNRMSIR